MVKKELSRKFLHKERFAQKGFLITVDAFLSVTLMLLLITASLFYLSQAKVDSWNTVDLKSAVTDLSTILEKNLVFEDSIKQSSSELLLEKLNNSSSKYCFSTTIYNSSLSIFMSAVKTGCTKNSEEILSTERVIVVNSSGTISFYVARIDGWFK